MDVPNDSGLLFKLDKSSLQNNFNFSFKCKNYNVFNSSLWEIPVKSGDMIIFPGDLWHSGLINKYDYERVIIGTNFFICKGNR